MSSQNSDFGKLISLNLESLSFDSFGRNPGNDIVCVAPVRTIVRREEEIVLIRRVRKVEEIDASPACPVNTIQIGSYKLTVYANAGLQNSEDTITDRKEFVRTLWNNGKLPYIANDQDKPIKVKLDIKGKWNYGPNEFNALVGSEGNQSMTSKETAEGDMLFTEPEIRPAMLVAFKIENQGGEFKYKPVAYGEQLKREITLQPGERLYFINNDQPGYYKDNDKELTVEWTIVS
ncbi:hypothetical protein [Iningainema tapete]|uniref:Uncharacterized protein n=1 Tax=Iningainema tapete BLCC-T55 TaxID=2748662 RepID=A0A8J6XP92_9CYAN|nr:hypothetical protein [Iningainema tapete]MBD2778793.1 hypothetical protein [Iningainema tapete BLCC-T55]